MDRETYVIRGGELVRVIGTLIVGVHQADECDLDKPCVIHGPTNHHMRRWPLHWRSDRGIFERICPHGIGHPDPDQYDYWREQDRDYETIHGCDGCCRRRPDE